MLAHVVENGKVVNTIEVTSLDFPNLIPALKGGIGWTVVGQEVFPPEPVILPVNIPQLVTKRQAYQQLAIVGKLSGVLPALNAIPDPLQRELAIIEFEQSQTFERNRPLVITMGAVLGLDLDLLFIEAAKL